MSTRSGAAARATRRSSKRIARSDVFLLPTGGENFGHAIFEALSCGVPVLISDQTPWRGLEAIARRLGFAAGAPGGFVAAHRAYAALPADGARRMAEGARACARAYVEESGAAEASARLIRRAIGGAPA